MIGQLRTRAAIHVPQLVADTMGGAATNWVQYKTVWAHVKPAQSAQRSENGRAGIKQNYLVIIRWQAGFPERARLHFGGHILRVISASDPDLRRERLHLICEEEAQ